MTPPRGSEIELRAIGVDEWQFWRALRLEALGEAPYAFSSNLSDWQGEGDTEVRWRARLSSVPLNVVACLDGEPAGMASATSADRDGTIELISMWVAPFARGRGVGDALVEAVVEWALKERAAIALAVMQNNEPATALYHRHRFVDAGNVDCTGSGVASERRMVRKLAT